MDGHSLHTRNNLVVAKFGGTSVGDAARIARAADLVIESSTKGDIVVVTSAMSGVTNELIAAANEAAHGRWQRDARDRLFDRHKAVADELIGANPLRHHAVLQILSDRLDRFEKLCFGLSMVHELTPRLLDAISGIGEMLCAPLLAEAIVAKGRRAEAVNATDIVVTTDHFGAAEPILDETRQHSRARLLPLVEQGVIPVVTGFIGATRDGVLTTLGRGGSDYSASIIGAVLDASEVWIWTDVDGVMTANPSEVPEARTLSKISYGEASELAYYGAKILHYKTILPAARQKIPVRILNSFNAGHPGTRVDAAGCPSITGVKAVTAIRGVSLISINGKGMRGVPGIVAKAFDVVATTSANILMISQASSENNFCFVVSAPDAARIERALRAAFEFELALGQVDEISAMNSVAIVAAVGDGMKGTAGIAAKVFGALGSLGINVIAISQGSSERNISLLVNEKDATPSVVAIHRAFKLDELI
jgi:aspartate kinase